MNEEVRVYLDFHGLEPPFWIELHEVKNKSNMLVDYSTTQVHKIGHDLKLEDFDESIAVHLSLNKPEYVEWVWAENWYLDIKLVGSENVEESAGEWKFPQVGIVESIFKEKFGTPWQPGFASFALGKLVFSNPTFS